MERAKPFVLKPAVEVHFVSVPKQCLVIWVLGSVWKPCAAGSPRTHQQEVPGHIELDFRLPYLDPKHEATHCSSHRDRRLSLPVFPSMSLPLEHTLCVSPAPAPLLLQALFLAAVDVD